MIAFIGSVFSPYYAWARRSGPADPENHVALNVVLYGPRGGRWAMTERGRGALHRDETTLAIGPSALAWDGTALTIRIDEATAPLPARIRGTVRLLPPALARRTCTLDAEGRHRWTPFAACAHAEIALEQPSLRWSGPAYFDSNDGDIPLERSFVRWDWGRARRGEDALVTYDVWRRDGSALALALVCTPDGAVTDVGPFARVPLPPTFWRVTRGARADAGHDARVVRTLTDAPFYARSVVGTHLKGAPATMMHESLSLDRFRLPLVQAMLPFRMPRALRAGRYAATLSQRSPPA